MENEIASYKERMNILNRMLLSWKRRYYQEELLRDKVVAELNQLKDQYVVQQMTIEALSKRRQ